MSDRPDSPRPSTPVVPPPVALKRRMHGRDVHEQHRASTPLELLFDLTAVVAVAAMASRLHHGLAHGTPIEAMLDFAQAFFVVWWPWMSYTWFASAYDTDDLPFRVATLVQMIGVLLIAVGIPQEAEGGVAGTVGFFLMRATLVIQWCRAALEHAERRRTCLRYAVAIGLLQLLWLARASALPPAWQLPAFALLAVGELSVPVWAARAGETPWHAHHVAERYSLFTIILLGECMVASANAISGVLGTGGWSLDLAVASVAIVGLLMTLWWAYFVVPFAQVLHLRRERGFLWGYGHAVVFMTLAALGGVLEVVADALKATGMHASPDGAPHGPAAPGFAMGAVAVTVALFFAALWWLGGRSTRRRARNPKYVLPVLIACLAAWSVVSSGASLGWGLLLLTVGPTALIAWVTRDRIQQPESFAVR
jgi:low temperature requirement protein LtrA